MSGEQRVSDDIRGVSGLYRKKCRIESKKKKLAQELRKRYLAWVIGKDEFVKQLHLL